MYFLIDGYNLLFRLHESKKSLQFQREQLIRLLQKEFRNLHLHGSIVFDGRHYRDEQSGLDYRSPLTIVYSPKGQTADDAIIEKLETMATPSQTTVITDDRFLAGVARSRKAHTMNLQTFIKFLEKKQVQKKQRNEEAADKRPLRETPYQAQRLLKEFEERLKNQTE